MTAPGSSRPVNPLLSLDRRNFLKVAGGSVMAAGLFGSLAACGASQVSTADAVTTGSRPRRGGTLRVGLTGGGTSDTLDPHDLEVLTDIARASMLYDQLVKTSDSGPSQLRLAQSITPNTDATEWTIKIRPGVKFHDGTTLTAGDILFNFQRIVKNSFPGAASLGPIELAKSKVVDSATLVLKFSSPYAQLIDNLAIYNFGVVPQTFNPLKPVGTGPFKFKSFTPGTQSLFVRNDDYWEVGFPYLDAVALTDVADETAQVNGMQAGQFDVVGFLSAASISPLTKAGLRVVVSDSGGFEPYIMDVAQAPFDDVRVRQAFKLIVDRNQLTYLVFGGHGKVGNDVTSIYDPLYDSSIPQYSQDIKKAKALLAAAGHVRLSVDLFTCAGVGPGAVSLALVFAQQAKAAGVEVNVIQQETTDYFANTYKKVPFSMEYWQYLPYMAQAGQSYLVESPWNSTHRNDPIYNDLYKKASALTDKVQREAVVHQMMKYDHEQGGYIIPNFMPVIDAWSRRVGGEGTSVTAVAPGGCEFSRFWINE